MWHYPDETFLLVSWDGSNLFVGLHVGNSNGCWASTSGSGSGAWFFAEPKNRKPQRRNTGTLDLAVGLQSWATDRMCVWPFFLHRKMKPMCLWNISIVFSCYRIESGGSCGLCAGHLSPRTAKNPNKKLWSWRFFRGRIFGVEIFWCLVKKMLKLVCFISPYNWGCSCVQTCRDKRCFGCWFDLCGSIP